MELTLSRPKIQSGPRLSAGVWALLKGLASIGLLLFLGWRARDEIAGWFDMPLRVWPLVAALILLVTATLLNARRWHLVAKAMDLALGVATATRLMFAALFASQVMPGMVGLDVMRAGGACWIGLPAQRVLASVVGDRLVSLVGMVALVSASIPLLALRAGMNVVLLSALPIAALAGAVAAVLLVDRVPLVRKILTRWTSVPFEMLGHIRHALFSPAGAAAVLLAVFVQLLSVAALIMVARGMGVEIAFADGLIVLPAALLVASLPISINGWGVREGAIVYGFGLLGIDDPRVFTVSVMFGLWIILSALPGGLLWLSLRRLPRQAADSASTLARPTP
jgi:glycosyltransferase 2 family protein